MEHYIQSTAGVGNQCDSNEINACHLMILEIWQLYEIWKFSAISVSYIVSLICINHIGLTMNERNKTIIKLYICLQNKIRKLDHLLIGGYQSSSIFRNAAFNQSIGIRNFVMKYA